MNKLRVLFIVYSPTVSFANKKMAEMEKFNKNFSEAVSAVLVTPDTWRETLQSLSADTIHLQQLIPDNDMDEYTRHEYFQQLPLLRDYVEQLKAHNLDKA